MPRPTPREISMDLILWRHAEAEEADGRVPDAKRRLTARGEKQAQKMARWLHAYLPKRLTVLVSPSERTQQTAHALALPFELEKKIGVDAGVADLLAAARWPEKNGTVLVVGHQPTLGRAAAFLLSGIETDLAVKKAAIWWLTYRERDGVSQTTLKTVIGSDLI